MNCLFGAILHRKFNQKLDFWLSSIIRDCVAASAVLFGLVCRTEVALPGSEPVPAKVFFPSFSDEATAVDVSVVHLLHPSYNARGSDG